MAARVVADLKACLVERLDFVPGQKSLFVFEKPESFGNEERRSETITFQHRRHEGDVRLVSVVERQDDQLVGNRQQLFFRRAVTFVGGNDTKAAYCHDG